MCSSDLFPSHDKGGLLTNRENIVNPDPPINLSEEKQMIPIKHGEERNQKIKVNHGKTDYYKREKYCVKHGWIDLFFVDELSWYRQHFDCDKVIQTGVAVEVSEMRKAA